MGLRQTYTQVPCDFSPQLHFQNMPIGLNHLVLLAIFLSEMLGKPRHPRQPPLTLPACHCLPLACWRSTNTEQPKLATCHTTGKARAIAYEQIDILTRQSTGLRRARGISEPKRQIDKPAIYWLQRDLAFVSRAGMVCDRT